jgi:putative oxidoreductase
VRGDQLGVATYELPLHFAIIASVLALTGPGQWSLDHGRFWHRQGIGWGLAAIWLGARSGALVLLLRP